MKRLSFDELWMGMCQLLAKRSPCMSRQIGAVIVRDNILLAMGYNGPPRGIAHCDERWHSDPVINEAARGGQCPRQAMGFKSGEGLEYCPAEHAERNAIIHATLTGTILFGATMYCNCGVCCLECAKAIIQAGITRVVLTGREHYDLLGMKLFNEAGVYVGLFEEIDLRVGEG
jgi:dCMP deaminase